MNAATSQPPLTRNRDQLWLIRRTEERGEDRRVWYLCMGVLLLVLGEAPAEWEGKAAAMFKVVWVITVDNKQQP